MLPLSFEKYFKVTFFRTLLFDFFCTMHFVINPCHITKSLSIPLVLCCFQGGQKEDMKRVKNGVKKLELVFSFMLGLGMKSLHPMDKKLNFLLRIASVNMTKSAGNCRFGHIYWRNPPWKTSFSARWMLAHLRPMFHSYRNQLTQLPWQSKGQMVMIKEPGDFIGEGAVIVNHHPAKFSNHRYCGSGDIMV